MRKIKEVLRLRYELDLDQRQIARSCSISVSTVHEYLKRAEPRPASFPLKGWRIFDRHYGDFCIGADTGLTKVL
jgi:predicted DNA-binding protein (UPF0251 family)